MNLRGCFKNISGALRQCGARMQHLSPNPLSSEEWGLIFLGLATPG
jgi:hypothetical protein